MADDYIPATPGSGLNLDSEKLTVGSNPNLHRQRTQIAGSTAAAIAAVSNADPATSDYALNVRIVGQVPNSDVDYGSPVKIGGVASSSALVGVSTGDRVNAWFSTQGELHTVSTSEVSTLHSNGGGRLAVNRAYFGGSVTAGTGQQIIAAGGEGVYAYVIGIHVSNGAAATRLISIEQGSGAGTVVWSTYLPAGGAFSHVPLQVICASTANSPLYVDIDTTGNLTCSVTYLLTSVSL